MKKIVIVLTLLSVSFLSNAQYLQTQVNGEKWYDTAGNLIDAHARSYIKVGDTYYWFGEKREGPSDNQFRAFNCYASKDLVNWTFRNTVLTAEDVGIKTVGTRVDVLYNDLTKQFVMYFKSKNEERKYGLATCATIDGHYDFKGRFYPSSGDFGDGTLFKEDDGTGYLVYSCLLPNASGKRVRFLLIDKLSSDYLSIESNVWKREVRREAPVIFKKDSRYYMLSSGVTGWRSNQAQYIHATSLAGPWTIEKNIGNEDAYDSQASGMLTVKGTEGTSYFYVGDRWKGRNLQDSRYLLLPIQFIGDGVEIFMDYYDSFYINAKTGLWSQEKK
tara:strand:- start:44831 stop:45820 length:990 start_codon:yes stop_codon:yes gene_type:complete